MTDIIYVEEIQIIGCQAFEDVTYNLEPDKLNVICAPNNVGKSILIKLLNIVGCPTYYDSDTKFLIRTGYDCTKILFRASDGVLCSCEISEKKVTYYYMDSEGGLEVSSHPSPQFLRHAGLVANEQEEFIANIVDDSRSLMLVDPKSAASVSCIHMLVYDEQLEQLKEMYPELVTCYAKKLDRVNEALTRVTREIDSIEYVDEEVLETKINRLKLLRELGKNLVSSCKNMETLAQNAPMLMDFTHLERRATLGNSLFVIGTEIVKCFYTTVPAWLEPAGTLAWVLQAVGLKITDLHFEVKDVDTPEMLVGIAGLVREIGVRMSEVWYKSEDVEQLEALAECGETLAEVARKTEALPQIRTDFDRLETLAMVGEKLSRVVELMAKVVEQSEQQKVAEEELSVVHQYLEQNAKLLQCPVHGEVAYNGKTCIPTGI